ncbi:hypothetical protein [Pseudopelagicola sp. nBUS_19]|uniref:hypothetical protein n=1 Tax=Pseudopelagicola sp. nBUS_19 TaxID=3395316 RepID=UPI003EB6E4A9
MIIISGYVRASQFLERNLRTFFAILQRILRNEVANSTEELAAGRAPKPLAKSKVFRVGQLGPTPAPAAIGTALKIAKQVTSHAIVKLRVATEPARFQLWPRGSPYQPSKPPFLATTTSKPSLKITYAKSFEFFRTCFCPLGHQIEARPLYHPLGVSPDLDLPIFCHDDPDVDELRMTRLTEHLNRDCLYASQNFPFRIRRHVWPHHR